MNFSRTSTLYFPFPGSTHILERERGPGTRQQDTDRGRWPSPATRVGLEAPRLGKKVVLRPMTESYTTITNLQQLALLDAKTGPTKIYGDSE